ncbi:hypothetical protein EYF80_006662 [Liparis tanakae]|uniref:Uncharacterized protein n=1 Tax=Liparis tanakae TaxID=230148 RepID=A0A4Z2IYJ6_9TELE|nr:hypothetical protein EYF80_006662 [Liparis tanakae]
MVTNHLEKVLIHSGCGAITSCEYNIYSKIRSWYPDESVGAKVLRVDGICIVTERCERLRDHSLGVLIPHIDLLLIPAFNRHTGSASRRSASRCERLGGAKAGATWLNAYGGPGNVGGHR